VFEGGCSRFSGAADGAAFGYRLLVEVGSGFTGFRAAGFVVGMVSGIASNDSATFRLFGSGRCGFGLPVFGIASCLVAAGFGCGFVYGLDNGSTLACAGLGNGSPLACAGLGNGSALVCAGLGNGSTFAGPGFGYGSTFAGPGFGFRSPLV
jgi:hypothetical protein